jgi:hypothetical protein
MLKFCFLKTLSLIPWYYVIFSSLALFSSSFLLLLSSSLFQTKGSNNIFSHKRIYPIVNCSENIMRRFYWYFEIRMSFMTQSQNWSASSRINILSLFTLKPAIVNISLNLFSSIKTSFRKNFIIPYPLYHALHKRSC